MSQEVLNTINEIIKKQAIILGPEVAVLKAREVEGLEVLSSGEVISLTGDPLTILQNLVDKYVSLSGMIVKKAMEPLLQKHFVTKEVKETIGTGIANNIKMSESVTSITKGS